MAEQTHAAATERRDAGERAFELRAFRRPIVPELGNLFGAALGLAVLGFVGAYPLIRFAGLAPWPAIALSESIALLALAATVWNDHAPHPAGTLRLSRGRLRWDGWRRAPVDVPIGDVKKWMIVRYAAGRPAVLVIWLSSTSRIFVHEPRLPAGTTLEDVLAALEDAATAAGIAPAVRAASERALRRELARQRLITVAAVALVALAVLRLLLS